MRFGRITDLLRRPGHGTGPIRAERSRGRRRRLALVAPIVILAARLAAAPGPATAVGAEDPPATTPDRPAQANPAGGARPEMVHIAGGKFVMGLKSEVDATPHEVSVSPFEIDARLVTQQQFERVAGMNPSRWRGTNNPVEQVRWSDAVRYCNKRSEAEGLQPCYNLQTWECNFATNGYRLPTEAEWEFACRAGATSEYFFGDSPQRLGEYAWYDKNAGGRPHPVGQKKPNAWGLYDMAGEVWQWCNDFYQVDYYKGSPAQDPTGPKTGATKVVRGGAWRFSADNCRAGYRYNENPGYSDVCFGYDIYGFRCVRADRSAKPAAR